VKVVMMAYQRVVPKVEMKVAMKVALMVEKKVG